MSKLLTIVAIALLLYGGVSNLLHPQALEEYLAFRVTWRSSVVIPLVRMIAFVEIVSAVALILRLPGAIVLTASVFLVYAVVHTYELVRVTPLGCPCAAGVGTLLPPRLIHATLGAVCAVLCVGLFSLGFRWVNTPAKETSSVQPF